MKKDYEKSVKQLYESLGGEENIESFFHCMTRMRFKLSNWDLVKDAEIKDGGYATGVNKSKSNEQYQIIIGTDVDRFFQAFCEINGYEEDGKTKVKQIKAKANNETDFITKQTAEIASIKKRVREGGLFSKGLAFISQVFTPIVVPLLGYGLIMTIWSLMTVEWNGKGSSLSAQGNFFKELVSILDILVNAFSLFITISIGYTTFKAMKCNVVYGIIITIILTAPGLIDMGSVNPKEGESMLSAYPGWTLFGAGKTYPWKINYCGLIIPMIIVVVIGAYIERLTEKISSSTVKMILAPVLIIGGSFLFGVFIMAPIGLLFTNYLSIAIGFLSTNNIAKYIAIPIIGAIYGPLVITGLHHSLTPIILQGQAKYGATLLQGCCTISNISEGIASIAFVVLYKRVLRMKDLGVSNGVSAILGGITEPSLYTINLKHFFPLLASCIGVFAGTIIMVASNSYALQGASSIFGILMFLQQAPIKTGVSTWFGGGIMWGAISVIAAAMVTFIMTLVLGKIKYFANKSKAIIESEYNVVVDDLNAISKDDWKGILLSEKDKKVSIKSENKKHKLELKEINKKTKKESKNRV